MKLSKDLYSKTLKEVCKQLIPSFLNQNLTRDEAIFNLGIAAGASIEALDDVTEELLSWEESQELIKDIITHLDKELKNHEENQKTKTVD